MGRKRGVQYRMGSFFRSDDRSGFTRRAENTKKEWTGLIVDKELWEIRQPQDFVKGVVDNQTVPEPRPAPPAVFIGPISIGLSRAASPGDVFLYLQAVNGFTDGNKIGLMLDSGQYFNTTVSGAPTADGVPIADKVPGPAAEGNVVTDYGADGP